jgi:hypothetical protein
VKEFLREEYQLAFRHDHWNIGIVDAPIHAFLERDGTLEVKWFPLPPRGTYFADPFGLPRESGTEVLFEEFDFRSSEGSISWARAEADGCVSPPRPAIELPFHASYPFLVERGGSVFCIPETAEAREVSLYRAVEFPHRWAKDATLIPGFAGLDNTLVERDGRFWLYNTDRDDGPFSKLRVWYAPDLRGPWKPHPANPVKTDLGSARPAGTPFVLDGELYRPSQDSSKGYGGSVVLNRVLRMTTTEYREERAATVAPFRDGPHRHGIHTLSAVGDRTLVDGKRYAFNEWAMVQNVFGGRQAKL